MDRHLISPHLVDITMLCLYLSSWDQDSRKDPMLPPTTKAWRGYLYRALDDLEERGLIKFNPELNLLVITPEGLEVARAYIKTHFPDWDPFKRG